MFKDYLNLKKLSMYRISKEGGIPYSTLNDLVNGRVEIENCKVVLLIRLANYLNLSLDELYALLTDKTAAEKQAAVSETNTEENNHKPQTVEAAEIPNAETKADGPANDETELLAVMLEEALHKRFAPGSYIGTATDNCENLLELMTTTARADGANDFDHLRRICKKGGMAEDVFKKGLAYIVMTDYILAQQGRSPANVFIEKSSDGQLLRFVLPEAAGNVLFLEKGPKSDDVCNLEIAFLKKKERKLLKLVADKSVIDKDKIPSKEELEKTLSKAGITPKRVKKICSWYDERIRFFKLWLDE